jgi:hypothetical protein
MTRHPASPAADTCTQDYRGGAYCYAWPFADGTLSANAYGRSPNCLANAYENTVGALSPLLLPLLPLLLLLLLPLLLPQQLPAPACC